MGKLVAFAAFVAATIAAAAFFCPVIAIAAAEGEISGDRRPEFGVSSLI